MEEERIKAITNKAQNPNRTERMSHEDLLQLENFFENFHVYDVYTHTASSTSPWNKGVRKSMVENVKDLARKNLLDPQDERSNGEFVGNDKKIHSLARNELTKNKSIKIPAILLRRLGVLIKSIGRISCGRKSGTCWIVSGRLVITCHHVYRSFMQERREESNPTLPIEVSFDYFYTGQPEHIHTIEVDEDSDPEIENFRLDYKFLRLKENQALEDRDSLGQFVRNRSLDDGLVIIIGHPKGKKMLEETCVVIRKFLWRTQAQRRQISAGLHMTNDNLLNKFEKQGCLPYDTTLFYGSSGSPVFDLNGNIVAMHTQGYTLDLGEDHEVSLMEFGVQFSAIYEDMRRRNFNPEVYFPDYNLGPDEERMDEDSN